MDGLSTNARPEKNTKNTKKKKEKKEKGDDDDDDLESTPSDPTKAVFGSGIAIEDLQKLDRKSVEAFATSLKLNACAIVSIPEKDAEVVRKMQMSALEYFTENTQKDKSKYSLDEHEFRYGYWPAPDMGKELFQVRLSDPKAPWPSHDFREICDRCFSTLHELGETCLVALGSYLCDHRHAPNSNKVETEEGVKCKKGDQKGSKSDGSDDKGKCPDWRDFWTNLCKGCSASDFPLSSSLLDLFHYNTPSNSCPRDSCSAHTDYNLLTLIPRSLGASGLEVFSWKTGHWDKIEASLPSSSLGRLSVLVLPGESLRIVSGKFVSAAVHRVVVEAQHFGSSGEARTKGQGDDPKEEDAKENKKNSLPSDRGVFGRLSTPFLLFANPNKYLTPAPGIRADLRDDDDHSQLLFRNQKKQTADDFVRDLLRRHESVTFGRKYSKLLAQTTKSSNEE